jgi:hypothetical protein
MNGYTLAVFAHVLGALGLAVSLALEWVRETRVARRIGGISLVTLLVAGLYLGATAWSNGPPWISIALAWFVAIGALTGLGVALRVSPWPHFGCASRWSSVWSSS